MKRIFINLLAFSLLFISCDNDTEILDLSTLKNSSKNSAQKTSSLENDLKSFAINHIKISNEISYLINQNKDIDFSKISIDNLESSRNENDLKVSLENAGIVNSDVLIIAFKKQVDNFHQTLANNKDFLNLNTDERNSIVVKAIDSSLAEIENTSSVLYRRTCHEQWVVDTDRCTRNYYWAGGLAVLGTFATGGWGLLGVAGAVATYQSCLSDALEDYRDCKS